MNWKSEPSYQIRDKAYALSFGGAGDALRLLSALIGGESGSNRNHEGWGKKSLGLERHLLTVRDGASLPISRLRAGRARGGAASTVHDGVDFCQRRFDEYSRKEDGVIRI